MPGVLIGSPVSRGVLLPSRETPSGLLTSLVFYAKLDEASGTRVDMVGGNDLTDNNTVPSVAGKIANAANFTSLNAEYLNRASNPSLVTGDIDFTIVGWIYQTADRSYNPFITKWGDYAIIRNAFGGPFFRVWAGGVQSGIEAASLVPMPLNQWVCVSAWHDSVANTINIQANDGAVSSVAHALGVDAGGHDFRIGDSDSYYADANIDEVGIWKRVLTATERTNLYNGGAGVTYPFTGVP